MSLFGEIGLTEVAMIRSMGTVLCVSLFRRDLDIEFAGMGIDTNW